MWFMKRYCVSLRNTLHTEMTLWKLNMLWTVFLVFLFIHFKWSVLNDYLDLNFKMAFPTLHANTKVNINTLIVWGLKMYLQTLLLAVVALVLFRLAVDEGEMLQLYSLFFFSVCKGGGHRKITIIIEDPVAGSQCRGAASCPPFHFCPLAWFTFATFYFDCPFSAFSIVFFKLWHNIPVLCHSLLFFLCSEILHSCALEVLNI